MTPGVVPLRVAALLVVVAALGGCGDAREDVATHPAAAPPGRVLLVGIDGAAPEVVEPLLARGELPHLAALAREGARGTIRSLVPIESPSVWNTIATGKLPPRHGILGFARKGPDGGRTLYLSHDRTAHALWNIASDAGLTVGVVNFWNTYPPEIVDGVMVSDHLIARNVTARREMTRAGAVPEGPVVYPPAWQTRAETLLAADEPLTDFANPLRGDPDLPPHVGLVGDDLVRRFDEDGALARIALAVEAAEAPDLLMVLLPGVDRASHFLWAGMVDDQSFYPEEIRFTERERVAARRALETYYRYADALVGLLVARYGEDDLILVLSDHGFEPGRGLGVLTGVHEGEAAVDGIVFARGPGITPGTRVTELAVADVTPTLLAWMGLPVGEDMDGRIAAFVDTGAVERVATYDTEPVPRMTLGASGAEDEMIDRLEALGYLE